MIEFILVLVFILIMVVLHSGMLLNIGWWLPALFEMVKLYITMPYQWLVVAVLMQLLVFGTPRPSMLAWRVWGRFFLTGLLVTAPFAEIISYLLGEGPIGILVQNLSPLLIWPVLRWAIRKYENSWFVRSILFRNVTFSN